MMRARSSAPGVASVVSGLLGLACGHVESGELSHQAVSRECLEELGVHDDDLRWFRPSDLADLKMAHPASQPVEILNAFQVATD